MKEPSEIKQQSKIHTVLVTAAATALVSSTVTFFATRTWESYFPKAQQPAIKETPHKTHLGALRDDYPPLAFTFSYIGNIDPERIGLFGMWRRPPRWVYDLSVANLTKTDIAAAEISVHFPKRVMYFQLATPVGTSDANLKDFPKGRPAASRKYAGEFRFAFKGLKAGTGRTARFFLYAEDRVTPSELEIEVTSSEGKFTHITPLQHQKIGWQR